MDWNAFSPASALAGGALIGLGALLLFLGIGRIAGVSGILGSLIATPREAEGGLAGTAWRLAFIVGIALGALLVARATGAPAPALAGSPVLLAAAGLLVGYGTRLGSGCTSGHGICGLARLSPRSLVAVATFMALAMLTTFVLRHLING